MEKQKGYVIPIEVIEPPNFVGLGGGVGYKNFVCRGILLTCGGIITNLNVVRVSVDKEKPLGSFVLLN